MGASCRKSCCCCCCLDTKKRIPIVLLGLDNAGKTDVAHRLFKLNRADLSSTQGCKVYDGTWGKYTISMSELGGAPNIRGIWKYYLLEAYGVIFVIDSSDIDRLEEAKETLKELLRNPHLEGKPFLILGNKQDASGALDYVDICYFFELNELANTYRNPCMLEVTGSYEGDKTLHTAFCWLMSTVQQRYKLIKNINKFYQSHIPENPLRPVTSAPRHSSAVKKKRQKIRPKTAPHVDCPPRKPTPAFMNDTKEILHSLPVIVTPSAVEEYSSDNPDDNPDQSSQTVTEAVVQVHRVDERSPRMEHLRINNVNGPLHASYPSDKGSLNGGYYSDNGKPHLDPPKESELFDELYLILQYVDQSIRTVPNPDLIVEDLSLEMTSNGNI